eukprot:6937992-Pyramimonas_sp.AAC.1
MLGALLSSSCFSRAGKTRAPGIPSHRPGHRLGLEETQGQTRPLGYSESRSAGHCSHVPAL